MDAGVRHLKQLLENYGGDVNLTLAAYNAGSGAVARSAGVPHYAETQNYVRRITNLYYGGFDLVVGPVAGSCAGSTRCAGRALYQQHRLRSRHLFIRHLFQVLLRIISGTDLSAQAVQLQRRIETVNGPTTLKRNRASAACAGERCCCWWRFRSAGPCPRVITTKPGRATILPRGTHARGAQWTSSSRPHPPGLPARHQRLSQRLLRGAGFCQGRSQRSGRGGDAGRDGAALRRRQDSERGDCAVQVSAEGVSRQQVPMRCAVHDGRNL